MMSYFSLAYFLINLTILVIMTITPIFRANVHCFGQNDCFPLALGVPAIFMVASLLFLLMGKSLYKHVPLPSENVIVQVVKCITNAIVTKIRDGRTNPRRNWLDYSIDKYGEELVGATTKLMNVLMVFIPMPVFWCIFETQSSRWLYQATKMNGDIGIITVKPDQAGLLNTVLVLALIPVFETVIYPCLRTCGLRRPLQRMTIGGFFASIAFLLSALVQFKIESSPDQTVSMLWLIPQYVAITISEIMFSITAGAFAYEQAPQSMKSVVQSFLLLTNAVGNLITVFIVEFIHLKSVAYEFILFSGILFVDIIIFMIFAYKFKSRTECDRESDDNTSDALLE